MKILLLGGTGAMGGHMAELLNDGSNEITVTTRSRRAGHGKIRYVHGNAHDEAFLKTLLLTFWDAIVDFMVYKTLEFSKRYDYLLKSTAHYVYISSARVYANSESPITESSPRLLDTSTDLTYLATDEYALSKARQENMLLNVAQKNWTIIRPYITYSSERLQLGVLEKEDWLYRTLAGRTLVASKDVQSRRTTLTCGLDVARGIQAILGQEKAKGEVFHITAPVSVPWSDVMAIYLLALEEHLRYKPVLVLQNIEDFTRWRASKYQLIYDRLYDRTFDNSKIGRFIDITSFIMPDVGLGACITRFLANETQEFKAIHWKAEAIKDRMLEERSPLAVIPGIMQKAKYFIFRNLSQN